MTTPTAGKKKVECSRCTRRWRGRGDWNVVFKKGYVVGYLCPTCQSAEENAEAVINEATVDYSTMHLDSFGRWVS